MQQSGRSSRTTIALVISALTMVGTVVASPPETNLAVNASGSGYPSPLESDPGWGGGSYPWEIVDGQRSYPEWYHGLAFTGGSWEPSLAGPRQATINFQTNQTFHKAIIWHHGLEHIPAEAQISYWNGSAWVDVPSQRTVGAMDGGGAGSTSDEYVFASVTGSKVRWSFDNRLNNTSGVQITHGWIYEFEVFGGSTLAASSLSIRSSQVELCFDTRTNAWYQLQYRSTLTTNQWIALNPAWLAGNGSRFCTNDAILTGQPQRFYRLAMRTETNLAVNASGSGYPSPLESDPGWGGGSYPWEIVDGQRSYPEWYHGLAFTGGSWEPSLAGPRQATINFQTNQTFHKAIIWHHGLEHIPADAQIAYWNGSVWVDVPFQRTVGAMDGGGAGSTSDEYVFAPVTGSKVRWSFDNRLNNTSGVQITHGWIYEFEVFGAITSP